MRAKQVHAGVEADRGVYWLQQREDKYLMWRSDMCSRRRINKEENIPLLVSQTNLCAVPCLHFNSLSDIFTSALTSLNEADVTSQL
jgi:hypothetical protein